LSGEQSNIIDLSRSNTIDLQAANVLINGHVVAHAGPDNIALAGLNETTQNIATTYKDIVVVSGLEATGATVPTDTLVGFSFTVTRDVDCSQFTIPKALLDMSNPTPRMLEFWE
jgi:hypothetical protein